MGKVGNTHPTGMLSCYDLWPPCPPGSATDRVSGVEISPKEGKGEGGVCLQREGAGADPSAEPENRTVTHSTGMLFC